AAAARRRPRPRRREASRSAADGHRASASASSSRGSAPAQAAAASHASTSPVVRRRPARKLSSEARSDTAPSATAGSSPPEWAWPPPGNRPSASNSKTVCVMEEPSWGLEEAVALREWEDRDGVRHDELPVDPHGEGRGVHL